MALQLGKHLHAVYFSKQVYFLFIVFVEGCDLLARHPHNLRDILQRDFQVNIQHVYK